MTRSCYLGLDFGTSGVRACVVAEQGEIEEFARLDFGNLAPHEQAAGWRTALFELIAGLPAGLRKRLAALAMDGTSATMLACDGEARSLHAPLAYHDSRARAEAGSIAEAAGAGHPAATATSGLAKILWLERHAGPATVYLNQADWLSSLLIGRVGASDYHNALKTGFDVTNARWPDWLADLIDIRRLPRVLAPGEPVATVDHALACDLGLAGDCLVRAGTTDSIAAFLATGAKATGDAVTSLGSTLVLKLVSTRRVDDARQGIYSHWFGNRWLAGGASNAGGTVLKQHFSDAELIHLSADIDPRADSGFDYYPLPAPGERFPINDPDLPARLTPRPDEPARFLHGMLEGLARIEALGYRRLVELGADRPQRVLSAGGGAGNPVYTKIRERHLRVPTSPAARQEAAYGSALLARDGRALFGSNT